MDKKDLKEEILQDQEVGGSRGVILSIHVIREKYGNLSKNVIARPEAVAILSNIFRTKLQKIAALRSQ